jgi:hypothetical protein
MTDASTRCAALSTRDPEPFSDFSSSNTGCGTRAGSKNAQRAICSVKARACWWGFLCINYKSKRKYVCTYKTTNRSHSVGSLYQNHADQDSKMSQSMLSAQSRASAALKDIQTSLLELENLMLELLSPHRLPKHQD